MVVGSNAFPTLSSLLSRCQWRCLNFELAIISRNKIAKWSFQFESGSCQRMFWVQKYSLRSQYFWPQWPFFQFHPVWTFFSSSYFIREISTVTRTHNHSLLNTLALAHSHTLAHTSTHSLTLAHTCTHSHTLARTHTVSSIVRTCCFRHLKIFSPFYSRLKRALRDKLFSQASPF